jgi:hypothetical protein
LWVTEENCRDDHVLLPGDAIDLAQPGLAIALAHRPARVVVEVPAGIPTPRAVEIVLASDASVRRIALAVPTSISVSMIAAAAARVLRRLVARWTSLGPASDLR